MPNPPLYAIHDIHAIDDAMRRAYATLVMAASPHLTHSRLLKHLSHAPGLVILTHQQTVVGGCMLKSHHRYGQTAWHKALETKLGFAPPSLELGYKVLAAPACGTGFSKVLSTLALKAARAEAVFATCSVEDLKTYHTLCGLGFVEKGEFTNPRTNHHLIYLERPANA